MNKTMPNLQVDPNTIATLLHVPRREIAVRCGVTSDWLRILARDPRHSRRVLIAVLQAALEQNQYEEIVTGGAR